MIPITAVPVERDDEYGFWTHPAFDELCGDREGVPAAEFHEWLAINGLEYSMDELCFCGYELAQAEYEINGSFTQWQPEPPTGEGWFIGSIHDSEDGPVCIWFRNAEGDTHDHNYQRMVAANNS